MSTTPEPPPGPPLHGFRGPETPAPTVERPAGVTVAFSREAGARGVSLATAVAARLGWPVYTPDALDVLSNAPDALPELRRDTPDPAARWADRAGAELIAQRSADASAAAVARLLFALAAKGSCVVVGRGAGFVLPRASTVHVRVVAPFDERAAYLAQSLRLTADEAAKEAVRRDETRGQFVGKLTDQAMHDPTAYDFVVNSSRLPDAVVAELIATLVAARSE